LPDVLREGEEILYRVDEQAGLRCGGRTMSGPAIVLQVNGEPNVQLGKIGAGTARRGRLVKLGTGTANVT